MMSISVEFPKDVFDEHIISADISDEWTDKFSFTLINESDGVPDMHKIMDVFIDICCSKPTDLDQLEESEMVSMLHFTDMYCKDPKDFVKRLIYDGSKRSKKYRNDCVSACSSMCKYYHETRVNYSKFIISIVPELAKFKELLQKNSYRDELHYMFNMCKFYAKDNNIVVSGFIESPASMLIKLYKGKN